MDCLRHHFQAIFGTGKPEKPIQCAPWLPDRDDICTQLRKTKSQEAVAPGTAPGIVIKVLAEPLADWLAVYIWSNWRSSPDIPSMWKDAHLSLLAKRKVASPADLKPIADTRTGQGHVGYLYAKGAGDMLPTLR